MNSGSFSNDEDNTPKKCPPNYKQLTGIFHGTNKICYVSKPDANPEDVDTEQTNIGDCADSNSEEQM